MSVACISTMTVFLRLENENYELKNLLAKAEIILTFFFSLAFFSLELMIHYLVIISKL